jgi:hypothetical protein
MSFSGRRGRHLLAAALAVGAVYACHPVTTPPGAEQAASEETGEADAVNRAPTAADWTELAKLPDWSGTWNPNVTDQFAQVKSNPLPWRPGALAEFQRLTAAQDSGRPKGLFVNCLPEGMPSWMLISHNAMEILFTPGRVTLLGESDGNRLRRIYTDGRPHPEDLDPTFHGHSIGHWEGDTLVVDTVGILPEVYIAVGEAVGVPNNGGLHVIERIHLVGPDELADDLEIIAPKVLTAPWKTTRTYFRQRARLYDILEGVCLQGRFSEAVDENGNAAFVPITTAPDGSPLPSVP